MSAIICPDAAVEAVVVTISRKIGMTTGMENRILATRSSNTSFQFFVASRIPFEKAVNTIAPPP